MRRKERMWKEEVEGGEFSKTKNRTLHKKHEPVSTGSHIRG